MVSALPAGSRLLAEDLSPWSTGINNALQPPVAHMRNTVATSVTSGGTGVAVTFTTEDFDTANGHSTSVNTSRYTFPVDGKYRVSGGVSFAAAATGRRGCWWRKNGTDVNGSEAIIATIGAGAPTSVPARSILIDVIATDWIELIAFQDSGGSVNTAVTATQQSTMSVELVYRA